MALADAPINPPPGVTDVTAWSLACATRNHKACKGWRINPDPRPAPDATTLPCECTVCVHQPKRRGRPPKQPAGT
ncbi:hypothetical protein ACQP10_38255 (plasmid) [Streptosporangium sandarakinum]|uniref:hypothetical protein n=1 Tax=Streptosporangium sandarakinum TaxID=1260955 RepID=UPI003D91A9E9